MTKRQPIRCFEGTAKPFEPFWRARNAAETGADPELEFYGAISEFAWEGDEITPKLFKEDLYRIGNGGPITLRVNSPGGDVIAASMIHTFIKDYPGKVTARIDGLAASAAVLVAMSASQIKIQDSAFMMIHDPSIVVFLASLDIALMKSWLGMLETIKTSIVDTYVAKTGISQARIEKMMSDETWMTANQAVNFGFADEVIGGGDPKQMNIAFTNALSSYHNVPPALLLRSAAQREDRNSEVEKLRDEIKILS
jgi:ATP-dependent Clp protease, protease subunit